MHESQLLLLIQTVKCEVVPEYNKSLCQQPEL